MTAKQSTSPSVPGNPGNTAKGQNRTDWADTTAQDCPSRAVVAITEDTALRLAEAMERLANLMEQGQFPIPHSVEHLPDHVAGIIIGGPEALKAYNKRNRLKRPRSSIKKATGQVDA